MYGFRGVCLLAFNPLFKLLGKRAARAVQGACSPSAYMAALLRACPRTPTPVCTAVGLTLPETAFATVAGLRGSLTLIMAADFIIHSDFYSGGAVGAPTGLGGGVQAVC